MYGRGHRIGPAGGPAWGSCLHVVDLVAPGAPPLGVTPSADGYVRLTPVHLRGHGFLHLLSGLDAEAPGGSPGAGATEALISGYTEWATHTAPALSLGWDWTAEVVGRGLRYRRSGEPRGNILLLEPGGRDFDEPRNALALGFAVDEWPWQEAVAAWVESHCAWDMRLARPCQS